MAHVAMAWVGCGPYSYSLCSYGLFSCGLAYIRMAYIFMAYTVVTCTSILTRVSTHMAYTPSLDRHFVRRLYRHGLYCYDLYTYGLYSYGLQASTHTSIDACDHDGPARGTTPRRICHRRRCHRDLPMDLKKTGDGRCGPTDLATARTEVADGAAERDANGRA